MEYVTRNFYGLKVTLRDLEEGDIETIVDYWHESDPAFLQSLGVDLNKLSSKEETRRRLWSSLAADQSPPSRAYFVVTAGDELLIYTNLNFASAEEACAHFHVLKPGLRSKGVSYFLFPEAIRVFFERFPIQKLVMQTSPHNEKINRLLRRFSLTPQRAFLEKPDGMARAGEFNIYEICRADIEARYLTQP